MTERPDARYAVLGYKTKPNTLDISRGLSYISLKDQVSRAAWVVDALVQSKALAGKTREDPANFECELLVIGAGAAGLSAALRGAAHEVSTLLIDKGASICERQIGSPRLVSLSLYDWPGVHWSKMRWPDPDSPVPLSTAAGMPAWSLASPSKVSITATQLAADWAADLDRSIRAGNPIAFKGRCYPEVRRWQWPRWGKPPSRIRVSVYDETSGRTHDLNPCIVIFALGPGSERVTADPEVPTLPDDFVGQLFWMPCGDVLDDDPIRSGSGPVLNLLVTGAGDGAVQDVIRALFKPDYHDLGRVIRTCEAAATADGVDWESMLIEIATAEWHTERARDLGGNANVVHDVLHEAIKGTVRQHLQGKVLVLRAVESMLRSPVPTIHWAFGKPERTLDRVYALNRFLSVLLMEVVVPGQFVVYPTRVKTIKHMGTKLRATFTDRATIDVDQAIVRNGIERSYAPARLRRLLSPWEAFAGIRDIIKELPQPFKPIR